jgi:hypothetical protein
MIHQISIESVVGCPVLNLMMSMKKFLKGKDVAKQDFSYNRFATVMHGTGKCNRD